MKSATTTEITRRLGYDWRESTMAPGSVTTPWYEQDLSITELADTVGVINGMIRASRK